MRPTAIELSYRDEMGRPRKMSGWLDGPLHQHEMDHLNGVLFVDRVTDEAGLQKELKENGFQRQHVQSVSEFMPMKPLAELFLALACVLGIASTGCVFELAGDPDLGVSTTSWILGLAAPAPSAPCWWRFV